MSSNDGNGNRGSGEQVAPPLQPSEQTGSLPDGKDVARAQFRGTLYQPAEKRLAGEQPAAVIALPDPDEGVDSLKRLVVELLGAGLTVLTVSWSAEPTYPEILAILPGAIEFLTTSKLVDPARIGVLGVELGGDLAIRAASTDRQIASVLAFAPYLSTDVIDAGLITRLRRPGLANWERLVEQIGSMGALRKLTNRQIQLVFGEKDRLIDVAEVIQRVEDIGMPESVFTLEGARHDEIIAEAAAVSLARQWFVDTLLQPSH
jgi:hypothetical protein